MSIFYNPHYGHMYKMGKVISATYAVCDRGKRDVADLISYKIQTPVYRILQSHIAHSIAIIIKEQLNEA